METADPKLTPVGQQEALVSFSIRSRLLTDPIPAQQLNQAVHARWVEELTPNGLTIPQSFYSSALQRAARTAELTFSALPGIDASFSALVVEVRSIGYLSLLKISRKFCPRSERPRGVRRAYM